MTQYPTPRFNEGQPVTPKAGAKWIQLGTHLVVPEQGKIYHVKRYTSESCACGCGALYLQLVELPGQDALQDKFDPVELTTEQLTAMLEEPQLAGV